MATLSQLSSEPSDRPREASHYQQLLDAWRRVRERWPASPEETGRDTLLYAVCLVFFYKGQTDYPDVEDAPRLLQALTHCSDLDLDNEEECEAALHDLCELPGVRPPRASALLHCLNPDRFPIVDRNAAGALCGWAERRMGWPEAVPIRRFRPEDMTRGVLPYLDYRRVLLALVAASKGALTLRQVEYGLYSAGRLRKDVTGL
jgi:hypothetical protein